VFVDTEPRSAKLHQRLEHQPTFASSDALSFLLMQTSYFQLLACSSTQTAAIHLLLFQSLPHSFHHGGGCTVPHLPIPQTRRQCTSLSPLDATPMDLATSVANKRLYVLAKSFRCNTYNKRGGRPAFPLLLLEYAWLPHHRTSPRVCFSRCGYQDMDYLFQLPCTGFLTRNEASVQVSRGIYPWWRMRSARERARWRAMSTKCESPAI
jgi:hypothetical protein